MNRSEKIQLTKEIKQLQEYLADLKHYHQKAGGKITSRFMLGGEMRSKFDINRIQKELNECITKRYPVSIENLTQNKTWAIIKDHEVCNDCENASTEQIELLTVLGFTEKFQLLDDDGNLYYTGLSKDNSSFAPLDDFGMPNAGCTDIMYQHAITKCYESL